MYVCLTLREWFCILRNVYIRQCLIYVNLRITMTNVDNEIQWSPHTYSMKPPYVFGVKFRECLIVKCGTFVPALIWMKRYLFTQLTLTQNTAKNCRLLISHIKTNAHNYCMHEAWISMGTASFMISNTFFFHINYLFFPQTFKTIMP